jgi:purine-binding chemotaxis protein CheW
VNDDWLSLPDGASLADVLAMEPPVEAVAAEPLPGREPEPVAARARRAFVLFTVAGSTYGIDEAFVSEVARVPSITATPHVPAWVRGVASLRGDIVSVVDLRIFLGLEPTSLHAGRLLVVRLPGEEFAAGLLVDRVDQIANLPAGDVQLPVSPIEGALAPYLAGVCRNDDRLVTVLDFDRFLRSPEIRQFERNDHATE